MNNMEVACMVAVKETVEEIRETKARLRQLETQFRLVVERRVQETSSSGTFFVSLPKEWGQQVGLEKGRLLTLVWNHDDTLTVIA